MATSVVTTFHGYAAGKTFTPAELRSGMASRANFVADSTTGKARPGILPGPGTPLNVTQASTPNMTVLVKAGTVVQQTGDSPGGVYSHTLVSDTNLDIGTAPSTNTRYDVVVAKVFDAGTTPTFTIEVLQGTAAASPALPSALTSPAANTYYFPLARILVGTNVTSIVNSAITKPVASGGLPNFGQFTVAPGGLVPVVGTTDGATLPPFTPFILPSGEQWIRHPNGTSYQTGSMHRYLHGLGVTTGVSGDFTINTKVWNNGTIADSPFPNAMLGAILFDRTTASTFNEPIWFKLQAMGSSFAQFRAYKASGVFTGATIDVNGIAWGW